VQIISPLLCQKEMCPTSHELVSTFKYYSYFMITFMNQFQFKIYILLNIPSGSQILLYSKHVQKTYISVYCWFNIFSDVVFQRIVEDPDIPPVPILILGNKTDKATAIGKEELIMKFGLQCHLNQVGTIA